MTIKASFILTTFHMYTFYVQTSADPLQQDDDDDFDFGDFGKMIEQIIFQEG